MQEIKYIYKCKITFTLEEAIRLIESGILAF